MPGDLIARFERLGTLLVEALESDVDDIQGGIAVLDVPDDDADPADVMDVLERQAAPLHLLVDAVNVLRASADFCGDALDIQFFPDRLHDSADIPFPGLLRLV